MSKFSGALAAACLLAFGALAATAAERLSPVVQTHDGAVQGLIKDGTRQYLGIPFAAPPVGDLRWKPPAPPAPWTGVRKATQFGGSCPQGHDIGDFAKPSDTEDCLYLNVYAPAKASGKPRAVMLWFPGGALFAGAADDYDGAKLARQGDIILVTMNYRIGVLGFFDHPAIDSEGHAKGNYAILDQQASLKWVRDNIAKFGGDPKRVTIAGQSAGGTSVIAHLLSPASKPLFARAINESGARMTLPTLAEATKTGVRFATDAGCPETSSPQSAACLRALSVQQIVKIQPGHFAGLILDGDIIPAQPSVALKSGQFAHVPILNGVAGDEQGFFLAIAEETAGPLTPAGYRDYLARTFGAAHADEVLKLYPIDAYPSINQAEIAASQMYRGCLGRQLNRWFADYTPTWAFQFEDRTTPSYLKPKAWSLGAYHTVELVYLFPGFHGGLGTAHKLNAAQEKLADQIVGAWTTFIRTGKPNPSGLSPWPRYVAARDNVQGFNIPRSTNRDGYGARYNCAVWDRIAPY